MIIITVNIYWTLSAFQALFQMLYMYNSKYSKQSYYYPYFTEKETIVPRGCHLLKVTWLAVGAEPCPSLISRILHLRGEANYSRPQGVNHCSYIPRALNFYPNLKSDFRLNMSCLPQAHDRCLLHWIEFSMTFFWMFTKI